MQAQRPEVTDARNNVSLEAFIRQMQYTNVSHASLLGEASMVRLERNEGYLCKYLIARYKRKKTARSMLPADFMLCHHPEFFPPSVADLRSLEKRRFAVRESGRKAIKRRAEFNTFVFREVRALEERLREARRRVVQQEADHRSELNSLLRVLSLLWARMRDSEKEMLRTKPAHEADHILPLYKFVEWCAEDMQTWRNDPDVEVRSYQEQLRVAQRIFEEVQNERSGHEKPDFLQHHGFQRTGVRGRGAALVVSLNPILRRRSG